jgi:malate dehydrogenase
MKVTIVGAGNVATCADVISYRGIASEVVLLDIKEGFAEALDIHKCATNTGFNTRVSGVTNDYTTADSNVVVITSGIPRKPG